MASMRHSEKMCKVLIHMFCLPQKNLYLILSNKDFRMMYAEQMRNRFYSRKTTVIDVQDKIYRMAGWILEEIKNT